MKIFDNNPRFFRTIPLPEPPYLWEKSELRFFGKYCKNSTPPFHKEGGSVMVAGLKSLKIMQFQRNFFPFKGLKFLHKMTRK